MENKNEIISALVKAQGKFPVIKKNKVGQKGNIKHAYADLAEIFSETQDICHENGLCHTFLIVPKGETVNSELHTVLMHTSGQTLISKYDLGNLGAMDDKNAGIAISYAKRYSLKAILGVEEQDDPTDNGWGADKKGNAQGSSQAARQNQKGQNTQTPRGKSNTNKPRTNNGGSNQNSKPQNNGNGTANRVTVGELKLLWKVFEKAGFTKEQAAIAVKAEFNKTSVELTKDEYIKMIDIVNSLGLAILEQGNAQ